MRRTDFPCGHRGRGQYCHTCQQSAASTNQDAQKAAARKQAQQENAARSQEEKRVWAATFAADPIDLTELPNRGLVQKVRELLTSLEGCSNYRAINGKRWESDRTIITVPVGWKYRLILRDEGGSLRPISVLSHEAYNNLRPEQLPRSVRP